MKQRFQELNEMSLKELRDYEQLLRQEKERKAREVKDALERKQLTDSIYGLERELKLEIVLPGPSPKPEETR